MSAILRHKRRQLGSRLRARRSSLSGHRRLIFPAFQRCTCVSVIRASGLSLWNLCESSDIKVL